MREVIRRFQRDRFAVTLTCDYDEDCDLSWADDEVIRDIEDGNLGCFVFKVAVTLDGREIGSDYLGGSVYADPREFAREHFGLRALSRRDNVIYGSYFPDMVHTAISEARATLRDLPKLRENV